MGLELWVHLGNTRLALPGADLMKLLRVKIKIEFFEFSKNVSYEAVFVELLVRICL